jgi:hypothetical protein
LFCGFDDFVVRQSILELCACCSGGRAINYAY